jgi:hypothetical protein
MEFTDNASSETVLEGTTITLSATDSSSSRFVRWADVNTGNELSTSKTYSFAVNSNVSIVAVFDTVYTLTVNRVGGKGKVTVAGESLDFYSNVATTSLVSGIYDLEANASDDYNFVCWTDESGKVLSTNSKFAVSVSANKSVTANFAEAEKNCFSHLPT